MAELQQRVTELQVIGESPERGYFGTLLDQCIHAADCGIVILARTGKALYRIDTNGTYELELC